MSSSSNLSDLPFEPVCTCHGTIFNRVNRDEMNKLVKELLNKCSINIKKAITVKYQKRIGCESPSEPQKEKLFDVKPSVYESIETIKKIRKLYDNYSSEMWKADTHTDVEAQEEDDFISALLKTEVMSHAMKFLSDKGFIEPGIEEYKRVLKNTWFHTYSRGNHFKKIVGSSGFEQVFLVEKKTDDQILGLNNWLFFAEAESSGKLKYFGHTQSIKINDRFEIAELEFEYDGIRKRSTMFIGTPPELDIALYTLCFYVNPDKCCKFNINHHKFRILTQAKMIDGLKSKFIVVAKPMLEEV